MDTNQLRLNPSGVRRSFQSYGESARDGETALSQPLRSPEVISMGSDIVRWSEF